MELDEAPKARKAHAPLSETAGAAAACALPVSRREEGLRETIAGEVRLRVALATGIAERKDLLVAR